MANKSIARVNACAVKRSLFGNLAPSPVIPIVSMNVNSVRQIIAFGKPKTELCQEFKTFEQLNIALTSQFSMASLFCMSVSFSSSCTKDAVTPTPELITIAL